MSCFNVIFTFLPPLCIGIFDEFVSVRMLDKYPQVYMLGQSNEFFNQKKFWGWFFNAVFHSLVLFFIGVGALSTDSVFQNAGQVVSSGLEQLYSLQSSVVFYGRVRL